MKFLFLIVFFHCCFISWCQGVDSTTLSKFQLLKEISVENIPLKKKEYILGTYRENTRLLGLSHGFRVNCYSEVAVYIPNDNNQGIIKNILVNVRNLHKDSIYNITLYTTTKMNKNGYYIPDQILFSVSLPGKLIQYEKAIDISALKLKVPETGIFVAFRGLDFDFKTTDNVSEKRTIQQIERGPYKDLWLGINSYKKTENARFGLLMEKK